MNYIVLAIAIILLIVVAQQLSLYTNKKYTNKKKDKTMGQTEKQRDFMNMCFLIWMLFMIIVIITVL